MQRASFRLLIVLTLTSCVSSPMSVDESESIVPPMEEGYSFCVSYAQSDPCLDGQVAYGEVLFEDGESGWCCRSLSRECGPSE